VLLAVCAVGWCNGKPVTDEQSKKTYKAIEDILNGNYEDKNLANCIINDFKQNKIADKLFDHNRILDEKFKLADEIKPFEESAKFKCDIGLFVQSPIGIIIILSVLLVLTILCCCCLRCLFWS
jgi:hypothetical protein